MSGLWLPRAADARWAGSSPSRSAPGSIYSVVQTAYQWNDTSAVTFANTPRPDSMFLFGFFNDDDSVRYYGPYQDNVRYRLLTSLGEQYAMMIWLGFPDPGKTPGSTITLTGINSHNYPMQVAVETRASPGFRGQPVQQQHTSGSSNGVTVSMDLDPRIDQHVWVCAIKHNSGGSGITPTLVKPWLGGYGVLGSLYVASDKGHRRNISLRGDWGATRDWRAVMVGLR